MLAPRELQRGGVAPALPPALKSIHEVTMDVEPLQVSTLAPLQAPLPEDEVLSELDLLDIAVPDRGQVRRYLRQHADLVPAVLPLCRAFRGRFGAAQLALELYRDPEIADQHLTLYVRQHRYDETTLDSIHEVYAPFADAIGRTSGWIIATTDFRLV